MGRLKIPIKNLYLFLTANSTLCNLKVLEPCVRTACRLILELRVVTQYMSDTTLNTRATVKLTTVAHGRQLSRAVASNRRRQSPTVASVVSGNLQNKYNWKTAGGTS